MKFNFFLLFFLYFYIHKTSPIIIKNFSTSILVNIPIQYSSSPIVEKLNAPILVNFTSNYVTIWGYNIYITILVYITNKNISTLHIINCDIPCYSRLAQ